MEQIISNQNSLELSERKTNAPTAAAPNGVSMLPKTFLQKNILLFVAFGWAGVTAAATFGLWLLGFFESWQAVLFGLRLTDETALLALPVWAAAMIFAAAGFLIAFLFHRRILFAPRVFYTIAALLMLYLIIGAVAARLWQLNVLAVPTVFTVVLTAILLQTHALHQLNRQLTAYIRRTAMATHLLEGARAESRLNNSLQLLQAVLPLEEIVIFKLDKNADLNPVGRARDSNSLEKSGITGAARQNHDEWREGVELCDAALTTGEPTVQELNEATHAARVAVPLVHEDLVLGAMLVRYRENYEPADKQLLTAFAAQLARNFQRQEVRRGDRQPKFSDFFSTVAAEHRLESFRTVSGLITEQQFGSLAFAEMVDGYAIAYLDGTLAYVNREMKKAAQITSEHTKQLDLFGLLDRFKGGIFDDPRIAVRRVMQSGEAYRHEIFVESRTQTLDLQITLVNEPVIGKSVHETQAISNNPLCLIVTVRDISAHKENERLRSDMVNLMSHELRTPITSINGFAELLMLEDSIPEESQEFLRIISTESQRLSRMLNTFLAVSKLEQGDKREVIKVPIKLDAMVHEVLMTFQPEARKKRIRLVEQANTHLPPVTGDKGLMTKVVTHLVDNAIKYSPERTTVTVSTVLEADAVRVVVEDRGYGIPAESIEKIWEKFYRVMRDGQDKDETSTGLGLSFVKEVVEQHDGQVSVESELNQGSKFSFTLPRL